MKMGTQQQHNNQDRCVNELVPPRTVRDTWSTDTSSTASLRRKFLSNYQFGEKQLRRIIFVEYDT